MKPAVFDGPLSHNRLAPAASLWSPSMSCCRFYRPTAAIFSRFNRHRPNHRARVRVSEEGGFMIKTSGDGTFHGSHVLRNLRYVSTRLRYSICTPFTDYDSVSFTSNLCKLLPTSSNHRSLATWGSLDQQEVTKAFELFLSTDRDVTLSREEMCNIYMEKLVRSGNLSEAAYLLRYLHSREIRLDLITYNVLLNAAADDANNFDLFAEIFEKLLLSSVPPDFTSYVNTAKAFRKTSDTNRLIEFVRNVSEITADREPTVMNRIIFVTAKSGQLDKSLLVFGELKKSKAKMDTVTFNTVLVMLGRAGIVDRMLSEFDLMKDLGHAPDIVTYNTLINCFRRLGRLELCKAFAKEMVERGIDLDLRTYTALVDVLGRAGHVSDAMQIFSDMRRSHCPSVYVYRAMISNLRKAGKFEAAVTLSEDMNSSMMKLVGPEEFKRKKKRRWRNKKVDLGAL